ncbi:MAG TPA: hypothetical protein VFH99_03390 [Candidatus Saccharimonadales bacterium]|nr:hypothetical protein [Candidatus Saccharimonadales bacterium]
MIATAAQVYGINPQALLVTLQKEQGLVSGGAGFCDNGDENKYAAAMGYGCPDSGTVHSYSGISLYKRGSVEHTSTGSTCVNSAAAAGFSQQVIRAAWLLKFGQQRSLGNVGWAVVGGPWNNSDDPSTPYGGPMTQGNLSRGDGSSTTFYDGYTTIDGVATHMDTGATAALYWYTPHFHGNQNFFNLFSGWFGSTHSLQPPGGLLLQSNQSGKVYFVTTDSNTRYFVPTWSTMQAYGLDKYAVLPRDDSAITSYSDGGTLKTLVFDNTDQKVYLVDGGKRYWFQQYCSEWGLDCLNQTSGDVTFLSSTYFDSVVAYGGLGQPIQQANGAYYLMQSGTKKPFITPADMQALGYSSSQSIGIAQTDLNSTQPLGTLQIFYPTFLQLNSQLLYFDGQNYHHVPSSDVYNAWGARPIVTPPTSSYNTTPPTLSDDLGIWVKNADNSYYLIDSGRKVDVTTNPTTWYSGIFQSLNNEAVSWLGTSNEKTNISVSGGIYIVQGGTKRHVLTYDDYLWLGINSGNTLNLSSFSGSNIPAGNDIIRDGGLFTVTSNSGLYLTNGAASFHMPSAAMFSDYGFNWGFIHYNLDPATLSNAYPSSAELSRWVKPESTLMYVTHGRSLVVDSAAATNWGINTGSHPSSNIHLAGLFNVQSQAMPRIVHNVDNGGLYYGSGGTYHYITSYGAFLALGGPNATVDVYSDFFTGLTQGTDIN